MPQPAARQTQACRIAIAIISLLHSIRLLGQMCYLHATKEQTLHRAKRYSTGYSRVVTQRSTNPAQSSLPAVIGRERGYSGWYDRSMPSWHFDTLYTSWAAMHHALPTLQYII